MRIGAALLVAGLTTSVVAHAGPPPGGYLDEAKYPNVLPPEVQFGVYGSGPGHFNDPMDVIATSTGELLVSDCHNNRIQVFGLNGAYRRAWGGLGTEKSLFKCPVGLARSPDGHIYVIDSGNRRLQVFNAEGEYLSGWGGHGTGPADFLRPYGIAATTERVYVTDQGSDTVKAFDRSGRFLFVFGGIGSEAGRFAQVGGIDVDAEGFLYIADSQNNRVQKFAPDGTFVKAWGGYGSMSGDFAEPIDLSVQGELVIVADAVNHRLQAFSQDGVFAFQWGRHPPHAHEGNGRLHYPLSVGGESSRDRVTVCEPFENRCQSFILSKLSTIENVDDSAWWEKATRFHYGSQPLKPTGLDLLIVSEPDTHSLVLFDTTETVPRFITRLGGYGRQRGDLIVPHGIAVDPKRMVLYASDKGNRRIQLFDLRKERLGDVIDVLTAARDGPSFLEPSVTHVDSQGNLYVIDAELSKIYVLDPDFRVIASWGNFGDGPGQFNTPVKIAMNNDESIVYVVDAHNYRIQAFTPGGEYLFSWGGPGSRPGEFVWPFGIVAGVDGFVYVSDSPGQRIQKFDEKGNFVKQWGEFGTEKGQFYKPKGLAQDKNGNIIVIDFGNHRGQIFTPNGEFVAEFGIGELQQLQ